MTTDKSILNELRIDRAGGPKTAARWALVVGAGAVVLVVVLLLVWGFNRAKPVAVRIAVVREVGGAKKDATLLNASGYVTARRQSTVSAKITGKVVEVLVEEGMKVESGQVLARLDSSN